MTPDTLRACYNFLNETLPFSRWNLPDGDDIDFRVVRDAGRFGWYRFDGTRHVIAISATCVGHTDTLIRTMAHELVHLYEEHSGACSRTDHGPTFRAYAKQICKHHGFDPRAF
jgi:hypothetical protein